MNKCCVCFVYKQFFCSNTERQATLNPNSWKVRPARAASYWIPSVYFHWSINLSLFRHGTKESIKYVSMHHSLLFGTKGDGKASIRRASL